MTCFVMSGRRTASGGFVQSLPAETSLKTGFGFEQKIKKTHTAVIKIDDFSSTAHLQRFYLFFEANC